MSSTRFGKLGISIAMDEFRYRIPSRIVAGRRGRSCSMPMIKLDKSFVDDIESDHQARAVMLAMMALGATRTSCEAEGVETDEQLILVRASVAALKAGQAAPVRETGAGSRVSADKRSSRLNRRSAPTSTTPVGSES